MSARWEDALEAAADVKRFWQSRYGHRFAKAFAEDMFDKGRQGADLAVSMPNIVPEALRRSDTMYVSEEMMRLLEVAKEGFQPEPLIPADLITEFGFVLLPRPLEIIDHQGKRTCYR